jgi:hypothetical protein
MVSKPIKRYATWLGIGLASFVLIWALAVIERNSPFGLASKANTIEAFDKFLKENPNDRRVPEARKRILNLKFGFQREFFLIYEGRDLSRGINLFNVSITNRKDDAATLAYVNAHETGDSNCRVTVRLVDKKTNRERTIVATSTGPEWVRVAVGSERITSSGGGSHTIDGHHHEGAENGDAILLEKILSYAETLESDSRPTGLDR